MSIAVKNAAGADVTIETPNANGRAADTASRPVVLSTQDLAAINALGTKLDSAISAVDGLETAVASTNTKLDAANTSLDNIETQAVSSVPTGVFPLPVTPVSGLTSAMTDTTNTAVTGVGTSAPGQHNYITQVSITNTDADTDSNVELIDGASGSTFYVLPGPRGGSVVSFPTPLKQPSSNTALYCKNSVTGASTIVSVNGFQA